MRSYFRSLPYVCHTPQSLYKSAFQTDPSSKSSVFSLAESFHYLPHSQLQPLGSVPNVLTTNTHTHIRIYRQRPTSTRTHYTYHSRHTILIPKYDDTTRSTSTLLLLSRRLIFNLSQPLYTRISFITLMFSQSFETCRTVRALRLTTLTQLNCRTE